MGIGAKELNSDLMGALRYLRNHIAHCKGLIPSKKNGLNTIKEIPLFKHLKIGDEINFSDDNEDVYEIVRYVKRAMDEIVISASKKDPEYRKVWYLD